MSAISKSSSLASTSTILSSLSARKGQRLDQDDQQHKAAFAGALKASGLDAAEIDTIQKQIEEAVKQATNGAQTTQGSRPRAVRDAVEGVLKDHGVDVKKLESTLEAQHLGQAKLRRHRPEGPIPTDDIGGPISRFDLPTVPKDVPSPTKPSLLDQLEVNASNNVGRFTGINLTA